MRCSTWFFVALTALAGIGAATPASALGAWRGNACGFARAQGWQGYCTSKRSWAVPNGDKITYYKISGKIFNQSAADAEVNGAMSRQEAIDAAEDQLDQDLQQQGISPN